MNKLSLVVIAFCLLGVVFACNSDAGPKWKETDLISYGVPVKLRAPEGIEVRKSTFTAGQEVVNISGKDNYEMEIWLSAASISDAKLVNQELVDIVKSNRYFAEMKLEEDNGFVYKLNIDSTNHWYGFRKVKVQGANQYIFQNPASSQFDEKTAIALYQSIP